MKCTYCGSELTDCMPYCEVCGQPIPKDQLAQRAPAKAFPHTGLYNLKWFKFLIYFSLFASTVLNAITGIVMIAGNRYASMYFDSTKLVQVEFVFGIISLVFAALALLTRFRLAGYHKDGPILLIVLYVASLIFEIAYTSCAKSALDYYMASQITVSAPSVAASITMIIVNIIYFYKRRELFEK